MINLKNYKGFALMKQDSSLEARRLIGYCYKKDIEIIKISKENICPKNYVPCATVEWCEMALGFECIPDYYPLWLKKYFNRKIWREDNWIIGKRLFVKPADKHKRFTGFITYGTWSKKKKPPLIWSEIVSFKNEWRYYISAGKIVCSEWYYGDEINTPPPPKLTIYIPKYYYGALDFGELINGKLTLVESQPPIACGWYGCYEDDEKYFQWLIDGWIYMNNQFPEKFKSYKS